jgi:hypothetical protein
VAIDEPAPVQSFHDQVEGGTRPRGSEVKAPEQCGLRKGGVGTPAIEPDLERPTSNADVAGDRRSGPSPGGRITPD